MGNVRCELRLRRDDEVVSATTATIEVCDTHLMGSLYQRVLDRIVRPDTERQFREKGVAGADHAFHPWFPVLLIGADKAALYTRALVGDIVHKHSHLTEPRWLLRVGVYLEFLTCLGIFEAVKRLPGRGAHPRGARGVPRLARLRPAAGAHRPPGLEAGLEAAGDGLSQGRHPPDGTGFGGQPAAEARGHPGLPGNPSPRPQARHRAGGAQSPQLPGNLVSGLSGRRAGGASQDPGRLSRDPLPAQEGPGLRPVASPRALRRVRAQRASRED